MALENAEAASVYPNIFIFGQTCSLPGSEPSFAHTGHPTRQPPVRTFMKSSRPMVHNCFECSASRKGTWKMFHLFLEKAVDVGACTGKQALAASSGHL